MKCSEKFFNKISLNKELIDDLSKLKCENWKKLSDSEKLKTYKKIFDKFSNIYSEVGSCNITVDGSSFSNGASRDNNIIISVKTGLDGNHYEILATFLHELRHFYQNYACELYLKTGVVHELFEGIDINKFIENNIGSALLNAENYISYSLNQYNEYYLQPIELDAEMFAMDFMKLYSDKFLDNDLDKELCLNSLVDYDDVMKIFKYDDVNLVNFSKVYSLIYEDFVSENKSIYLKDEEESKKYKKLLDSIEKLNERDVIKLLSPCFYIYYEDDVKKELINKFLKLKGFCFDVDIDKNEVFIDDVYVNSCDVFEIMELVFNKMADEEIRRMLEKNDNDNLMLVEKEIKLNFKKGNLIKKENNPLFYEVQPYMLYKNSYVLRNVYDYFRTIDEMYTKKYNFFDDFCKYVNKYDVETKIKKVKSLTGMDFDKFYCSMIDTMKKRKIR